MIPEIAERIMAGITKALASNRRPPEPLPLMALGRPVDPPTDNPEAAFLRTQLHQRNEQIKMLYVEIDSLKEQIRKDREND